MGAMQAMESAACFTSLLLALRASHPDFFSCSFSSPETASSSSISSSSIPQSDVEQLLATYQQRRHARATSVVNGAHFHCETQLKVATPMTDQFYQRLPHLTNELWLNMTLDSLCRADMLEGWPEERNSARVNRYTESSRRFLDGMARKKEAMAAAAAAKAAAAAAAAQQSAGNGVGGAVVAEQPEKRVEMVSTAA